jgi:N-acetylglucosaminyl-diphospho-decaprenol L-rhamnosyltransferase
VSIDVVIPTYNRADLVLDCLEHLERQAEPHTTIVVDNGSSDSTAALVRERFPDVRLVELPENLGFGPAINRALATAEGDVLVLINNDVQVEPGFLSALTEPLLRDPRVGSVAGVLLKPGGATIDAAGVVIDGGLGGYAYMGGGGAAAYRREAFDAVGAFDPQIFAYCEDVDLGLRLLAAGWACALAPDARAIHLGSQTLGVRSHATTRIASASRGYLMGRYRVSAPWLATELAVGVADSVLLGSFAPLTERVRGYLRGHRLPAQAGGARAPSDALEWGPAVRRRWAAARG